MTSDNRQLHEEDFATQAQIEAVAEALYIDQRTYESGTNNRHRYVVMTPWSEIFSGSKVEWRRKARAAVIAYQTGRVR